MALSRQSVSVLVLLTGPDETGVGLTDDGPVSSLSFSVSDD